METQLFEIIPAKSHISWVGRKVTGLHTGTVALKEGQLALVDGQLTGGNIVVDMTSIKVLNLDDPGLNARLTGHLASADFFDVANYPEAVLVITKVTGHHVQGRLSIKGITHPAGFDTAITIAGDTLSATARLIVDRTDYNIRFRSGNFFTDLGDNLIYNDFEVNVSINASIFPK